LAQNLRDAGQYQDAIRAYERLEQRLRRRDRKATVAVQIGETLLRDLHQDDAAEKAYRRVLETYKQGGAAWELRLGDIWRHRGKGQEARKAYQAARDIEVAPRSPNIEAVRVGTLARYVEEYTREQDWEYAFKYLQDWAWEFPLAKLEGNWSLLRARALLAKGDRQAALREALDLTGASPDSPYAVRPTARRPASCFRRPWRTTPRTPTATRPVSGSRPSAGRSRRKPGASGFSGRIPAGGSPERARFCGPAALGTLEARTHVKRKV